MGEQTVDLIEITKAMTKAGVEELRESRYGEPLEIIVERIYLMMEIERQSALQGQSDE